MFGVGFPEVIMILGVLAFVFVVLWVAGVVGKR